MQQPKVNILLATYNGEKFIRQQLDSLIQQTYENITIYIRDDGSKDDTVSVVEEYIRQNTSKKKIVLLDNGGVNLRCPKSFYEIFRKCEPADYYSMCDQDDIWYPQKVEWAVDALEKEEKDKILLYYTACDYSTADGEVIRKSAQQKEHLELKDVMYYTPGSGFTMVVNEKARQELILNVTPGPELHDRWLVRGAACFGKVIYDSRSSASHIRHEEAVTAGDAGNGNLLSNFIKSELCGPDAKNDKIALQYFYKLFENRLTDKEKKTLRLFCKKNNPLTWFQKVFYPHRLRTRLAGEIALRILFVLGRI